MTKPSSSTNCPHCFARIDVLPGPPAASPAKWLLVLAVAAAAFFAGWFANADPGASTAPDNKTLAGNEAPALKKSKAKRPPVATWEALLERASKDAGVPELREVALHFQPAFEKGKPYVFKFVVSQVGSDFILAASSLPTSPARVVLQFEENALDDVSVATGQYCTALAKFVGYRQVDLVSGASERYPVLELSGLQNLNTSSFYSFEYSCRHSRFGYNTCAGLRPVLLTEIAMCVFRF